MDAIGGVESIQTKLDVMQARLMARAMGNPEAIGDIFPYDFRDERGRQGEGRHWADFRANWAGQRLDGTKR